MAKLHYDKRRGSYYLKIQVDGERKYIPLGTNKRSAEKEAKRISQEGVASLFEDESLDARDIGVGELANLYLEYVKQHLSPATYDLRKLYLVKFLNYIGPVKVSKISKARLTTFAAWARKDVKRGSGREYLRSVRAMLLWGKNEELCSLSFNSFPPEPKETPPTRRFSREELRKLLSELSGEFKDMVIFGLLTGLRVTELINIEWGHLKEGTNGGLFIHIEKHKTSKSARTSRPRSVPLSGEAKAIIFRRRREAGLSGKVFLNTEGNPYTSNVFRHRFQRACKRAGVPQYPPTALRHTFASMQIEIGSSQISLAELMGHSNLRTTARYVMNSASFFKESVDKLERELFSDLVTDETGDNPDD